MWNTVLGSKRARGKKNRRNIRKFATRYPATQLQIIRRRILEGWSFGSPLLEAAQGCGGTCFVTGATGLAARPAGFGGAVTGSAVKGVEDSFASDSLILLLSPSASEVGPILKCGKAESPLMGEYRR